MRADLLNRLYSRSKTALEFRFDQLMAPPLYAYIHPYWIEELRKIATGTDKIKVKYAKIDSIMKPLGFKKFCAGTNRITYFPYEDKNVLIKIATDPAGTEDGPKEFFNQQLLKPYCTKIFDVSPCGTVSLVERVEPIVSIEEFKYIAEDIFYILYTKIIGKYILQDIGTNYFMNWGVRRGFGPCLLDFPYVFNIDGKKLYCSKQLIPGQPYPICGGEIDYDNGFNKLICTKCGKEYLAEDLGMNKSYNKSYSNISNKIIIRGGNSMKVTLKKGNEIIAQSDRAREVIPQFDERPKKRFKPTKLKVSLCKGNDLIASSEDSSRAAAINKIKTNHNRNKYFDSNTKIKVSLSGPTEGSNKIYIKGTSISSTTEPDESLTAESTDYETTVRSESKFIPSIPPYDDGNDDYDKHMRNKEKRRNKFNSTNKRKGKKYFNEPEGLDDY